MPTFERLTAADRSRIGRKGASARWAVMADAYAARKRAGLCVTCAQPAALRIPGHPDAGRQTLCQLCIDFRSRHRERAQAKAEAERVRLEELRAKESTRRRRSIVVHDRGQTVELVSIWDGRSSILDAIRREA